MFFKSPLVLRYLPTTCMLTLLTSATLNHWEEESIAVDDFRKQQKGQAIQSDICRLSRNAYLELSGYSSLTFNQKSRNLTLRMWVLGSCAWKVFLLLSDHYTTYFGSELIISIWNKQIFSEWGAYTTFLWDTCRLTNRARRLQNRHESTLSACIFRSLYFGVKHIIARGYQNYRY